MKKKILTSNQGNPVGDNQNSLSAGLRGPLLLQDVHLVEKLAHFNRERIPERVVHAKGAGAHGYFEVTHDVSMHTKANFLANIGKKTDIFIRFSTVAGESGSSDSVRDARGFSVKFYTEDGNYDIVGLNSPVFFVRDPLKFPDFIHSQKRNPITHLKSPDMVWDFWSLSPESLHQVTMLMSDRGIPATYRHMHGFGTHTFLWVNDEGKKIWVKYHFRTNQGIANLDEKLAKEIAADNPDSHTEDLFNAIEKQEFPSWTLFVQLIPFEEGINYKTDIFDVTKTISKKDYPLVEVGKLVLDKNPSNYFNEVEQATFSPGSLVPGIEPSPDKLLQGRLFAYGDAHRYRVGTNSSQLPVNAAINKVNNYQQDGNMNTKSVFKGINYEPNSLGGPAQNDIGKIAEYDISGFIGSFEYDTDYYSQVIDFYELLSNDEKLRLADTIARNLFKVNDKNVVNRQIGHYLKVSKDLVKDIFSYMDEL